MRIRKFLSVTLNIHILFTIVRNIIIINIVWAQIKLILLQLHVLVNNYNYIFGSNNNLWLLYV